MINQPMNAPASSERKETENWKELVAERRRVLRWALDYLDQGLSREEFRTRLVEAIESTELYGKPHETP